MNKFKLDIEYNYEFVLMGICCQEKDYRLCWAINNQLGFEFKKSQDFEIKEKRKKEPTIYSLYVYEEEEKYRDFFLIANKSEQRFLIPEYKETDYFIMIKGNIDPIEKEIIAKKLWELDMILAIFDIDPHQLKSKQNLLF